MAMLFALVLALTGWAPALACAGERAGTTTAVAASGMKQPGAMPDWPASKNGGDMSPERIWARLEASDWIAEGTADAPRIAYVFSDPGCVYCYRFWRSARPWVEAGRVQLRYLLVDLLGPNSTGMAATIMMADDPAAALVRHERQFEQGGIERAFAIPDDVRRKLAHNRKLLRQLGFRNIVPGIVVRDEQGRVQRWPGLPAPDDMDDVLGRLAER